MVIYPRYIIFFYLSFTFLFSIDKPIDIVTTNDLHGSLDLQKAYFINPSNPPDIIGASGFSYYMNNLRDEVKENPILLLDGGNFFQGTNFGMNDKGKTMVEWMNKLEYDVFVQGQYDFIFGVENLNNILKDANFSIVGANLDCNDCIENLKPYVIKDIDGIKVGIIGIVNSKRNGNVTSTLVVSNSDEIILSTDKGRVIRCNVKEIRIAGRNTQGVRIIKLSGEEKVVSAIKIEDNIS